MPSDDESSKRLKSTDDEVFELFKATKSKPSTQRSIVFGLNALATSAVPVYLYTAVFGVGLQEQGIVFAVVTLLSAYVLNLAYQNSANSSTDKLIHQRQDTITRQSVDSEARAKAIKHDEVIKRKRAEIASSTTTEVAAFAIVYNNVLFLLAATTLGFYVFGNVPTPFGYILSVLLAVALTSFNSTQ
eukprot:TRINITY_DN28339_c0_g1_i1.p1 TRINITY_DN28339_c0_g1~~TRINITY_DN28339_c0_g1_i1.p1  ORF type:complete len:187 (+),score=24.13 TRINITY_DN28339_c0_g1_i1:201-761(+)